MKALAGPPGSRNRAAVQMSKAPRFSMTRTPPPSDTHTVSSVPHAHGQWTARVPPAPPHQLLEPRLIASMQFELISCFRWSLANQGRQEAEVGAIKLTTLGPGSLRRKKQSRHQKAPPPTQPALPWGSLARLPGLSAKLLPPHPTLGRPPHVPTMPLCGSLSHTAKQPVVLVGILLTRSRDKPVWGGRGVG